MSSESIGATSDTVANTLADMTSTGGNARLNYNLSVDQAGLYNVTLRVSGVAGQITLLNGSTVLSTVNMPASSYTDLSTQIFLPAGFDSRTLQFQHSWEALNYLDLAAVPEPGTVLLLAGGML